MGSDNRRASASRNGAVPRSAMAGFDPRHLLQVEYSLSGLQILQYVACLFSPPSRLSLSLFFFSRRLSLSASSSAAAGLAGVASGRASGFVVSSRPPLVAVSVGSVLGGMVGTRLKR